MPNGGVPINLEFWMGDINSPGTFIFFQHARTLNIQRMGEGGQRSVESIGTIEITRPFLATVVAQILGLSSSSSVNSVSNDRLSVIFESGSIHLLTSDKNELAVLSGELLSAVAAFMAYWVDHDGEEVPAGLQIRYSSPLTDDEGREWNLHWAL